MEGMFLVFETEGIEAFGYSLFFVVNLFHDFWLAFEKSLSGAARKNNLVIEGCALVDRRVGARRYHSAALGCSIAVPIAFDEDKD